jgi:cytochrome c oxidase subunit 2
MFVDKEQEQDSIIIELYAKQFGWEARYAGADNVLGKANVRYIEGVNNLGVDLSDPNAQDDFASSELHIPKGKRVIFKMRSQDVLHSAYMPHFRANELCSWYGYYFFFHSISYNYRNERKTCNG